MNPPPSSSRHPQTLGLGKGRTEITMTEEEMKDAVQAADARRVAALVARDYDAFAALLSYKLVYHHASGKVDGKDSYLVQFRERRVVFISSQREQVSIDAVGGAVICRGIARNELEVEG